ncbi:AurF N-oxygenase family protein [Jongsikchunia kroppenstedtii]|uniref:AurF N-oxygenase family protein n=1 Tax=Jongsikchunia kroppenstedtii TaxID=1121721 RepID=UPI001650E39D|nr:diiron oxygenase [Jongsikchunia kroppenstedtii]
MTLAMRSDDRSEAYREKVQILSEGSVRRSFDAYRDIDWDAPEMQVSRDDERWILGDEDPFAAHPWYRSQSRERQIEMGIWRMANVAKVGLQFESALIRGIHQYVQKLPNGAPEFRYAVHEAAEECQHTLMFQEFVNRTGVDTPGMPRWARMALPLIPVVLAHWPPYFFAGVLAGEEPIDHQQKTMLRAAEMHGHPLFAQIMAIHVAEEARHISFAHEYLAQRIPRMTRRQRRWFAWTLPITMRVACDLIIKPPMSMRREFGIPASVMREVYWERPESRKILSDYFADVRMLAEDLDLMTPGARRVWRALKIDGEVSRYRSQPATDRPAA